MSTSGGSTLSSFEGVKTRLKHSFFGENRTSIGIDVGNSSVKVVELERKNDSLALKNYAIALGKEELIKPGTLGVISGTAGVMVKRTLENSGIRPRRMNVAVPSFSSLITTIEIPEMSQNEIEQVIQKEAPKYIPVRLSEVVYGWQIIEDIISPTALKDDGRRNQLSGGKVIRRRKNIHVLMVAIMKEISDQYNSVFSSSGLTIDSLEIDSFSLTRSLIGNDTGAFLILDIGHKVCNIIIVSNKNILLNRTIDVAGDRVTKVIAKALNISNERAEKLKIEQGLNIGGEGMNMVVQTIGILTREIQRTREALAEKYPEVNIGKIILSGGGSKLKGLKEFIENEVKIETVLGNPFKTIIYPEQIKDTIAKHSPTLSIAVGLAVLGFE
ncbi:MAG: pilus assembly protein PilM [Patescibacteria group bacterium]|nr:pilus assembly protein PilM [Patescibacteria group bacterium]